MVTFHSFMLPKRLALVVLGLATAWGGWPDRILGHENHAPLPTKGVTIQGDQIMLSERGREAIGMTLAKISLADLSRTLEVNVRVELPWRQQAMIASQVSGQIEQVLVRPGEIVAAGQELARVTSLELESLQLELSQAASEMSLARKLVDQRTGLSAQGAIAGKGVQEAETTLAQNSVRWQIARQKLLALRIDQKTLEQVQTTGEPLGYLSIRSPIAGTVTHADLRVGQAVRPTDHLYHVVDAGSVWLVGEVLEADVARLKKGQAVEARFASQPQRVIYGQIDHARMKVDPQTRTQEIVIAVDNADGALRPRMYGQMSIRVELAKQAIVCPTDALVESRTGVYVLKEKGEGKYVNQPVKLGLVDGDRVEVLDGLFPGDRVVVVGNYLLASLLGNEHKARKKDEVEHRPVRIKGERTTDDRLLIVRATVELPTRRQAFATARLEGRVAAIHAEPSQEVQAGQVLVEIESLPLRNEQLELLQALAKMRWTQASLSRLQTAGRSGAVAGQQLWKLESELQTLRQTVASQKRKLAYLGLSEPEIARLEQADLANARVPLPIVGTVPVRAPVAGRIVEFAVVPGQVVNAEDKLLEVQDLSKVWAKGYVFERDAARVQIGQPVQVMFAAYPDLVLPGTVVRTAPMLEASERVLPVWVELENADQRLKEGMLGEMTIATTSMPEVRTADSPRTAAPSESIVE